LEHPLLPSGGSSGTFAYNEKELIYLSQKKENLEKLLAQEPGVFDPKSDPTAMAQVITNTLIDQGTIENELIGSLDDLKSYGKEMKYKIDKQKMKGLEKMIAKPHWESETKLVFFCRSGFMGQTGVVKKFIISFDRNSRHLEIKEDVLAENVFGEIPRVVI